MTVDAKIQELMDVASNSRQFAYCPYSKFRVGASVLCDDGSIYSGREILCSAMVQKKLKL